MRPITGTDILDFYASRTDLLVLTANGTFDHIDGEGTAYTFITTEDDTEVQVLLERSTITSGDWFEDALDEDGNLNPDAAGEMAAIINADGILPSRVLKAVDAGKAWEKADQAARGRAQERAAAVAEVVAYSGGQSAAGRLLGLDQSTVNKLVTKRRRVTVVTGTLNDGDSADILRVIAAAGIDISDLNAPISTAGTGFFTRKTRTGNRGDSITAEEGVAINEALVAASWTTTSVGPALTVLHRPI